MGHRACSLRRLLGAATAEARGRKRVQLLKGQGKPHRLQRSGFATLIINDKESEVRFIESEHRFGLPTRNRADNHDRLVLFTTNTRRPPAQTLSCFASRPRRPRP